MRTLALCLALAMPSCLSAADAAKQSTTVMERAGHALEAVRAAYVAVCAPGDEDAGPGVPASPACDKAKAAFNAAQAEYTSVNSQL